MSLQQSEYIGVKKIAGKGRGVVAIRPIPADTVIERAPVLVMPDDEVEDTVLSDYVYYWGKKTVALALGYGSLYNHSYEPNARYDDVGIKTKVFTAIRNIEVGEEITINYHGSPEATDDVHFEVKD